MSRSSWGEWGATCCGTRGSNAGQGASNDPAPEMRDTMEKIAGSERVWTRHP